MVFYTTDSFYETVLKVANLGVDADITAAICGQVAGAFYGLSNVPDNWIECLTTAEYIDDLATKYSQNHKES